MICRVEPAHQRIRGVLIVSHDKAEEFTVAKHASMLLLILIIKITNQKGRENFFALFPFRFPHSSLLLAASELWRGAVPPMVEKVSQKSHY